MSKVWDYFKKEAGIAYCKNCEFKTNFGPSAPTTALNNHLKNIQMNTIWPKWKQQKKRRIRNDKLEF
jgi:hypothetical protein